MGEETTRLKEEIERTREDLTRDVDRLAEKTSPSRIVERRVQRTRGRLVALKEKIMGSSDTEPRYGYGTGATYGPTYTDDVYATRSGGQGDSRVESARESVSGAASHVAESTRQGLESTKQGLSSAKDQVAHVGERAQGAAHDAVSGVREQTEGNPLAAGLVAFGVGWLVSSLMPATQAETQAAQRAGDLAKEHGAPALDQAKQAAQEVGEELRDRAQEAAQQVKDRTQEAAGTVREEARSTVSS